jgi:hypothetical protein
MNDADYEARRERRERERKTGLAFTKTLRERLEAKRILIETLMKSPPPSRPSREKRWNR